MEKMLLHTGNIEAATAEIESTGGRVTMQLGDDLLIAQVPKDFITKKKQFCISFSSHFLISITRNNDICAGVLDGT